MKLHPSLLEQKPFTGDCIICESCGVQLYSICECRHRYCEQCCQEHIKSKLNSFVSINCLDAQCRKSFQQKCRPYMSISEQYKQKYAKFKRFNYFQKNISIKQCKLENCQGQYTLIELKCKICQSTYCKKCLDFAHPGQCDTEIQTMMNNLNYKQCQKCKIYVEKTQGCNYVSCKCGNHFCYTCGVQWSKDPCRLKIFHQKNQEIRSLLKKIRLKRNIDSSNIICQSFVILFQLLIIPIMIIFGVLIIPTLLIILFFLACIFLSPLMVILLICSTNQNKRCECISSLLVLVLYPLVSVAVTLAVLIFMGMYFCIHDNFGYHHGIYDPIEEVFLSYIILCLELLVKLVQL